MKLILILIFVFLLSSLQVFAEDCGASGVKAKVLEACSLLEKDKDKAFDKVRNIKFCGENYVWVQSIRKADGDDIKMLVHRAKRQLEGKSVKAIKDENGFELFIAFDNMVRKSKEGVVDYLWTKPGDAKATPKSSFVKDCGGFLAGAGYWK